MPWSRIERQALRSLTLRLERFPNVHVLGYDVSTARPLPTDVVAFLSALERRT